MAGNIRVLVLASIFALSPAAEQFEIILVHDSTAEREVKSKLSSLLQKYNLRKWIFTRKMQIDENAIPHSHPVLTLSTGSRHDDATLLADFIHEQSHWFEDAHTKEIREAVEEFERLYPNLPTAPPDGARGRFSTYMHLVVCYWELEGLSEVMGKEIARQTIERTASHHYRAVYRQVLDDTVRIRNVVAKHQLIIPEASSAP